MKITADTSTTGTITGRRYHSRVSPDAMAHIMMILSELYADAPEAVLREYALNARDSHVQAGSPAPIEVTLPTDLNPVLTVTDHGVGLDLTGLFGAFADYGSPFKRDDERAIGGLGIGAKSGFALTGQISVTAVKDGRRLVAVFAKSEEGPVVTVLVDEPTTDGNGVTVAIPVSDPQAIRAAATHVFSTWDKGTVLVDGAAPAHLFDRGVRVGSVHVLRIDAFDGEIEVVMGGVRYPASEAMLDRLRARARADKDTDLLRLLNRGLQVRYAATRRYVSKVALRAAVLAPLGAVDFTPTREALRDTERTHDFLYAHLRGVAAEAGRMRQAEVDDATSPAEAGRFLRSTRGWMLTGLAQGFTGADGPMVRWRGQDMPGQVKTDFTSIEDTGQRKTPESRDHTVFRLDEAERDVLVTGVADEATRTRVRRLTRRYLHAHHDRVSRVVFVPTTQGSREWVEWGPGTGSMTAQEFLDAAKALPPLSSNGGGGRTGRSAVTYQVVAPGKSARGFTSSSQERSASQLVAHPGRVAYVASDDQRLTVALGAALDADHDLVVVTSARQQPTMLARRVPAAEDGRDVLRQHLRGLPCVQVHEMITAAYWCSPSLSFSERALGRVVTKALAEAGEAVRHAAAAAVIDSYRQSQQRWAAFDPQQRGLAEFARGLPEFTDLTPPDLDYWRREWPLIATAWRRPHQLSDAESRRSAAQAVAFLNLAADTDPAVTPAHAA